MRKILILISLVLFSALSFGQGAMMGSVGASGGDGSSEPPTILDDGETEAWFIAHADYITIQGDSIIGWADVTDNNIDLDSYGSFPGPLLSGDSVIFDGGAMGLDYSSALPVDTCTVYMVVSVQSYTPAGAIMLLGGSSFKIGEDTETNKLRIIPGYIDSDPIVYGQPEVYISRFVENGTGGIKWGAQDENTDVMGAITPTQLQLGLSSSTASEFAVKEIIIRGVEDSASDRTTIANYLENKYGL